MTKGINLNPLIAVRTEPMEQSEQCTQLLFGECFEFEEHDEKWCYIKNTSDAYVGFVSKNMITPLSETDSDRISRSEKYILSEPVSLVRNHGGQSLLIPAGSCFFLTDDNVFRLSEDSFILDSKKKSCDFRNITEVAENFLNAPYLWGGKSILGIDCSGFVQLVFFICGKQLPRDASQQVLLGDTVDFLSESRACDLAFFENEEGRIVHVGILLDNRQIIHASGKVKVDKIDDYGIFSSEGNYSHRLRIIKRIKC